MIPEAAPVISGEDPARIAQATMRGAWLTVDLGAIAANVRAMRRWLPAATHLMAVVKADGYGHGSEAVSRTALAAGADWLGVATLAEGLRLRQLGLVAPILLLGLMVPEAYPAAISAHLDLMVSDRAALLRIHAAARAMDRVARVHLKVDTGMTRVGAPPDQVAELLSLARSLSHLEVEGLVTHFARAEEADPGPTRRQLEGFEALLSSLSLPEGILVHACNSAGALFYPEAHHDMVRMGLCLYGLAPGNATSHLPFPLRAALSVSARITQLREVPAGVAVGYGGSFVTMRESRLALLPVGYADGLPRSLSNRGAVLIGGRRCPLVGNISMDQCVADVTDLPGEAHVGTLAVFLGRQEAGEIGVPEWAELAGTIPYEIICSLGRRLPRVYTGA